jgi:hypothetical protein
LILRRRDHGREKAKKIKKNKENLNLKINFYLHFLGGMEGLELNS